jgi:hypothetical protein
LLEYIAILFGLVLPYSTFIILSTVLFYKKCGNGAKRNDLAVVEAGRLLTLAIAAKAAAKRKQTC